MTTDRYTVRTFLVASCGMYTAQVFDTAARKVVRTFDISDRDEALRVAEELNDAQRREDEYANGKALAWLRDVQATARELRG